MSCDITVSGREMKASCITYPSDQWAQHELIQTGQKNSTFHREVEVVRDESQQNIPAVSIKEKTDGSLATTFPSEVSQSCRRSAPFKSPEIPSHPSHLKLVENFLLSFSLTDAS